MLAIALEASRARVSVTKAGRQRVGERSPFSRRAVGERGPTRCKHVEGPRRSGKRD
jgi:hypothetical protein